MNLKRSRTLLIAGLFLFFAFVRFSGLADRPFHNDEGVNGFFTQNLIKSNSYKYDPLNYHGPTLYYFQLIPSWLAGFFQDPGHFHFTDAKGLSVVSTRGTMAFVSLLVLGALLLSAPIIGEWGALAAFALAGISATFLFYSRYFIHEIYVVFFTFGIFLSVWFLKKTRDAAYFYLAVLSSTLLICTKETGVLHIGVFVAAYVATILAAELLAGKGVAAAGRQLADTLKSDFFLVRSGPVWMAVGLCAATWLVFFSSFFHNFHGLKDFFVAYIPWIKQGLASGHVKPVKYFFADILIRYEAWLLATAIFGLGVAFIKNERTGLFLSFWTAGTLAVYSAIPYKTPWLAANFIVPLAMLAGYGLQAVVDWINSAKDAVLSKRAMAAFVLALGVVISVQWPLARDLNFKEWDNAKHPQVYVHTTRSMYAMLEKINDIARKTGDRTISINIFSKEYWPLPFYLKDNPRALFWGKLPDMEKYDASAIIISVDQHMALRAKVKDSYSVFNYALREGYYMELWVNNDRLAPFEPQLNVPDLLVSANPRGALRSGLFQEINSGFLFEGKSVSTKTVQDGVRFFFEKEEQKPTFSPFSVRWTGFIRVPTAGIYEFFLESDDGSKLTLDGVTVIDNGGVHALQRKSRKVNLSAGLHAIKAEYGDAGGLAEITLSWARPGEKPVPVPASAFFCVP